MKDSLLIIFFMVIVVTENLLAQSSTQSMEFPIYSDHAAESKTVDDSLNIETDSMDIYNINENNDSVFSRKKRDDRFGVYGILYGEPEKIKLSTMDTEEIGLGIGLKVNF